MLRSPHWDTGRRNAEWRLSHGRAISSTDALHVVHVPEVLRYQFYFSQSPSFRSAAQLLRYSALWCLVRTRAPPITQRNRRMIRSTTNQAACPCPPSGTGCSLGELTGLPSVSQVPSRQRNRRRHEPSPPGFDCPNVVAWARRDPLLVADELGHGGARGTAGGEAPKPAAARTHTGARRTSARPRAHANRWTDSGADSTTPVTALSANHAKTLASPPLRGPSCRRIDGGLAPWWSRWTGR